MADILGIGGVTKQGFTESDSAELAQVVQEERKERRAGKIVALCFVLTLILIGFSVYHFHLLS